MSTLTERPSNCRNALRDAGKPYPKSGCEVCKDGGMRGCPYERGEVPKSEENAPKPGALTVDALHDFQEGQWWLQELDAMVANGTPDQKRAVAVVRNLMRTAHRHIAAGQQGAGDVEQIAAECGAVIGYTGPGGELAEAAFSRKGLHEFARRLATRSPRPPKPAGAVTLPYSWVPDNIDGDAKVCTLKSAIAYGDAREAAAGGVTGVSADDAAIANE